MTTDTPPPATLDPTAGPEPFQDRLRSLRVDVDALGHGSVHVDGEDVSSMVKGVQITTKPNEPVEAVLLLGPAGGAQFNGMARVAIGEEPDPGPATVRFLSAIDANLLEAAALNREDVNDDTLTGAMLRQLIDWAQGKL